MVLLNTIRPRKNIAVFLFSILGMGAGSVELGKVMRKVENLAKFMCMKNAVPFSKRS